MNGAAAASTISYSATAVLVLILYRMLSGQGLRETLVIRRADALRTWFQVRQRLAGLYPRGT